MHPRIVATSTFALGLTLALTMTATAAPPDAEDGAAPYLERDGARVDPARMPLVAELAEISVVGDVAEVTLTQVYENLFPTPIEAVYVFPGSTRAAVTGFTMTLGDRVITARLHERQAAREVYEAAKTAGKTASLLEMLRPNVLRMNVANMLPGELVQVEITYVERVRREEGVYALAVPAYVGQRYTSAGELAAGDDDASPTAGVPTRPPGMPWGLMRGVSVDLSAAVPLVDVSSPSHRMAPLGDGATFYHHGHTELGETPRDFELRYRLGGDAIASGVVMTTDKDGETTFMATLEPPARAAASAILPGEYIFVLDISGSMSGWPLETAKTLLADLLAGLRPSDRFNVVTFAGGADVLAPTSLPATPTHLRGLSARIDALRGGGGTELLAALTTALALPTTRGFTRTLVVVTDGDVDAEAAAFRLVRERAGDANLFAFGVGNSCNRHLLEQLATAGRGEPTVVMDEGQSFDAAARFRRMIAAPVLTDIAVTFPGADVYDVVPTALPDLFLDRPLVVLGKLRGTPRGAIVVTGRTATGPFKARVDLAAARPADENAVLRTFWAREQVDALSLREALGEDVRKQIVAVALAHDLLTRHTSFVAVDERVRAAGAAATVVQPVPGGDGAAPYEEAGALGVAQMQVGAPAVVGVFGGDGTSDALGGTVGAGGLGMKGHGLGGGGAQFHALQVGSRASAVTSEKDRGPELKLKVTLDKFKKTSLEKRVLMILNRLRSTFLHCYRRALNADPTIAGSQRFELVLGADGRAQRVKVVKSLHPDVDRCVVARLRSFRISDPKTDDASTFTVTLTYAFER